MKTLAIGIIGISETDVPLPLLVFSFATSLSIQGIHHLLNVESVCTIFYISIFYACLRIGCFFILSDCMCVMYHSFCYFFYVFWKYRGVFEMRIELNLEVPLSGSSRAIVGKIWPFFSKLELTGFSHSQILSIKI